MDAPIQETPYEREPGYAERYRDERFRTGTGDRTNARETRALRDLLHRAGILDTEPASRWLDVPCGAGRLSGLLPGRVTQVDRDLAMVRAAAAPRVPGARVCASVHLLPFRDAAFDGVLCMRLLHHIGDATERRRILGELRRVTRGPLVFSFFHAFSLQNLRRVVRRRCGRRHTGRTAVTWRTMRADLAAAGFEVVANRSLLRYVSEQWLVLAR